MKQKFLSLLLVVVVILSLMPTTVLGAYSLPTKFGAPEDFSVQFYAEGDNWDGFTFNVTASKELRSFLDEVAKEGSAFNASGYHLDDIKIQYDFKLDNNNWHYSADWESKLDWMSNMSSVRLSSGNYSAYTVIDKGSFEGFVSDEKLPDTKSFFNNHSMDFKVRFIVNSQDSDGKGYSYASTWSAVYTYNNKKADVDPAKLINHAPVLTSVELKKDAEGRPVFHVVTEPAHEELRQLNSLSGGCVNTEVWIKVKGGEWKNGGLGNFVEQFDIPAADALPGIDDKLDAAVYDMKIRYAFNLIHSPGKSATSKMIYSPYSNIISKGHDAWSASKWATTELQKAFDLGLVPDSLAGADLTKPVTRAEFAAISVKLYEKLSAKKLTPSAKNPFKDTKDTEVLKAYGAGIAVGISSDKFQPNSLVTREEAATMLVRVLKKVKIPGWTFATDAKFKLDFKMPPKVSDDAKIASWAKESVYFMIANGIITSTTDNAFAPQKAASGKDAVTYTSATREQALVLSLRFVEKMGDKQVPYKKVN